MGRTRKAVFLDRDGVLVADRGLLLVSDAIQILPGVPEALERLHRAEYALVIVSNQAAVARGLLTEEALLKLQQDLEVRLCAEGAPPLEGFYYCPHHPSATVVDYRMDCSCRKPRPGLLLQAARDLDLDLPASFMIGDRPTDLQAGNRAGCRSIWLKTGCHADKPIETLEPLDPVVKATFVCDGLGAAADWILENP